LSETASKIFVITTTLPTHAVAEQIACELVEQKMAACVQITGPIQSIYHWEESVKIESEYSVQIKIGVLRLNEVVNFLKLRHPYELPQIVWETVQATVEYSQWVDRQSGCGIDPTL
jgi:periplasmic divalent cation tolerance protein